MLRSACSAFAVFVAFSAVFTLTACNSVTHLESVKDKDFTVPKNVYGYLMPSAFSADRAAEKFKKYMVDGFAECGIRLQFQPGAAMIVTPPAGFDSVLGFRELGHETVTQRGGMVGYDQFNDMYRLEVTVTALSTKKIVWKSQGEYGTQDNRKDALITKVVDSSAAVAWSSAVLRQMRADSVLGPCQKSDAIAPLPVTNAAVVPAVPVVAPAAVAGGSTTVTQAKPGSIRMNNVTYASLADAEMGMRGTEAQEIAQIAPFAGTPRPSLVIVAIPDKKPVPPAGQSPDSMDQIFAVMQAMNRVGYDTGAEAIRKSNLFQQVTLVREENVADGDFKGAAYKLWFSSGSWGLAKPGGARQKVSTPLLTNAKSDKMNSFLNELQQAAAVADGH